MLIAISKQVTFFIHPIRSFESRGRALQDTLGPQKHLLLVHAIILNLPEEFNGVPRINGLLYLINTQSSEDIRVFYALD